MVITTIPKPTTTTTTTTTATLIMTGSTIAATRDAIVALSSITLQTLLNSQTTRRSRPSARMSISSTSSISSISSISSVGSDNHTPSTTNLRFQIALAVLEATSQSLCIRRWEETSIAKCSQLPLVLDYFKRFDIVRFKRNLRVHPITFDAICSNLQHPIFTNRSTCNQLPLQYQVAIALYRFGHEGNGVSCEAVAQWAGVSVGTVVNVTSRVIEATLSKQSDIIRWASVAEKEEAKSWIEEVSGCQTWRNGYCMVDGTLIPLFSKPSFYGEAYFDRKSNYSLNVQLITLPNLRIIDYVVGHCGSTHDSSAFKDSRIAKETKKLFTSREWMWGDSAYTAQTWLVTPYKKPWSLQPDNRTFNYYLSKVRVRSEHAVGYLKGRFASLRQLRIRILDAESHIAALSWIKACIIIHTMIFWIEKDSEDLIQQEAYIREGHDEDEYEEGPIRVQSYASNRTLSEVLADSPQVRRRNELKTALLHTLHA